VNGTQHAHVARAATAAAAIISAILATALGYASLDANAANAGLTGRAGHRSAPIQTAVRVKLAAGNNTVPVARFHTRRTAIIDASFQATALVTYEALGALAAASSTPIVATTLAIAFSVADIVDARAAVARVSRAADHPVGKWAPVILDQGGRTDLAGIVRVLCAVRCTGG